jgi:hypothetical protein
MDLYTNITFAGCSRRPWPTLFSRCSSRLMSELPAECVTAFEMRTTTQHAVRMVLTSIVNALAAHLSELD